MKKLLIQVLILAITAAITVSTFAQSPENATRQRRSGTDAAQADVNAVANQSSDEKPDKTNSTAANQPSDEKADKTKSTSEVTAEGKTNRVDQSSEEEAVVPYYNNFFTTYRLGPEDVISVNVFGQDRYSKQGIKV